MTKVLIVYGSAYGQTTRIARRFADRLEENGIHTVVVNGATLPPEIQMEQFDGFVVAGSVRYGRHQRYLEKFVRQYHGGFGHRPSAFISVCGAMSSKQPEGAVEARKYRLAFFKRTGWSPQFDQSFAGGLPYTQYGALTRMMMKAISRRTGGPVDTSRDWDFTDWKQVDQFALDFAHALVGNVPAALVHA